jgi:hypothetical protein
MTSILMAAAISGIVTGAQNSERNELARRGDGLDNAQMLADGKHTCKGKNACKGQGGCKTDKHACKGQNACKGQGGCKG